MALAAEPRTKRWTVKEAWELVGGLSEPDKMPGYSYSLPARYCKTGQKLRNVKGSICSVCYAMRNRYRFGYVQRALERRFEALTHPEWVEAMAFLINHYADSCPYFRWHDSGDLQGVWHLENICQVARLTPRVQHWLPTHEVGIVKEFLRRGGRIPPNLVIRISAAMLNQRAVDIGLPTSSSSVREELAPPGSYRCPARKQGNQCGSCRACWDGSIQNVDYPTH